MVTEEVASPSLGFHKFLIWFLIPVEVLYLLWTVVNMLFGINYALQGLNPAELYQEYGLGLRITDLITAAVALLVAAFGVYTEVALMKRRSHGPAAAQVFFVSLLFVSLIYGMGLAITMQDATLILETTRFQIFNVAIAVLCFNYYKPRLGLFSPETSASGGHSKLAQLQAAIAKGVILFGSESEWWDQNKGKFQIVLGIISTIFILALVFYVVATLNSV